MTFSHYFDFAYLVPLSVAVLIPFTLLITYIWAAFVAHDVDPYLPTISQTYTDPPQAVWFSQLFSLIALMILLRFIEIKAIIMSEKYCHLLNLCDKSRDRILFWSKLSLILALVVSTSMSLLGSVRISELYGLHIWTSMVCFTSGPILYLIHTCISIRLSPIVISSSIAYIRFVLTMFMIIDGIVFGLTHVSPKLCFENQWITRDLGLDPEYIKRVVEAFTEYIYVLLISPYFLTYIPEIRRLKCIKSPDFEYIFK